MSCKCGDQESQVLGGHDCVRIPTVHPSGDCFQLAIHRHLAALELHFCPNVALAFRIGEREKSVRPRPAHPPPELLQVPFVATVDVVHHVVHELVQGEGCRVGGKRARQAQAFTTHVKDERGGHRKRSDASQVGEAAHQGLLVNLRRRLLDLAHDEVHRPAGVALWATDMQSWSQEQLFLDGANCAPDPELLRVGHRQGRPQQLKGILEVENGRHPIDRDLDRPPPRFVKFHVLLLRACPPSSIEVLDGLDDHSDAVEVWRTPHFQVCQPI
mmetsp:Transcript_111697/g.280998  ORF Transcript_111697/g.280998 Transcript_111697/m.280998 type:complete len:271 (-) Transcript_111697:569-1381(-)